MFYEWNPQISILWLPPFLFVSPLSLPLVLLPKLRFQVLYWIGCKRVDKLVLFPILVRMFGFLLFSKMLVVGLLCVCGLVVICPPTIFLETLGLLSWRDARLCQNAFLNLIMWFLYLSLFMWWAMLNDLCMLNHSCISRMRLTWSWWIILLGNHEFNLQVFHWEVWHPCSPEILL